MKIKELIIAYKKVLKYYRLVKRLSLNPHVGICGIAKMFGHRGVYDLFTPTGYYRNYIEGGYLIGPKCTSLAGTNFRIKFIKKEIVELEKLLSEGYTDV